MSYSCEDITVLHGLEPIRRRPGMYVGDTEDGSGMHWMLEEIIGLAIDPRCSYVRVEMVGDRISVESDGAGIPIAPHPRAPDRSHLEAILTQLHGLFLFESRPRTKRHACRGAGVPATTALSEHLDVQVWRDGRAYEQHYARGVALGSLRDVGASERTGARFTFTPDFSILARRPWDERLIARRLRELAALFPGLTFMLGGRAFRCPDGLADHARYLARGAASATPLRMQGVRGDADVEAALVWTDGDRSRIRGLVNTRPARRGTHVAGLRAGLLAAFRRLDGARFAGVHASAFREVIERGLIAVVAVDLDSPRFADYRHRRLTNAEAATAVESVVCEGLATALTNDAALHERLFARMPR